MLTASIVEAATKRALASGALQPLQTKSQRIEDGGVRFIVRVLSSLARKQAAARTASDPLGDYEPDLFVANVTPGHYVLLNKYNALAHHLLIVTRRFEPQEAPLTAADFEALAECMAGFGDLAFYNSGRGAGASQPHKHLQLVAMEEIPIEPFLDAGGKLPFAYAWVRTQPDPAALYEQYCRFPASNPYNLLVTRRWMLFVPRSRECFESLTVNALGFAGSLFVRTRQELERIRAVGPMHVLEKVGCADSD
jgi:ATP adenylyltransferase